MDIVYNSPLEQTALVFYSSRAAFRLPKFPMLSRSRAREVVLQLLYQDDLNSDRDLTPDVEFLRQRLHKNERMIEFAKSLLIGVRQNRAELDDLLAKVAVNWSLGRMAATDRNVLRLGAFEILHSDTPGRVAINEAVELAKRYGAKQSPQFVNGLLDKLLPDDTKTDEPND